MTDVVMVPDPDPDDAGDVKNDRDPQKLPAADQMCMTTDPDTGEEVPALYNIYRCYATATGNQPTANPQDPNNEVIPDSQKAGIDLSNATVIL